MIAEGYRHQATGFRGCGRHVAARESHGARPYLMPETSSATILRVSQDLPLQVPFRRLVPGAAVPERAHAGDAGYDLRSVEEAELEPGGRALVRTGISVAIPEGHAGLVLPRSGLAVRHGISLVNTPGLIDSGYRGEIQVPLINHDPEETFLVEKGTKIAQLVFVRAAVALFSEVESLEATTDGRGEAGFGSSGS
jgi:dUTP pyrophosphatase